MKARRTLKSGGGGEGEQEEGRGARKGLAPWEDDVSSSLRQLTIPRGASMPQPLGDKCVIKLIPGFAVMRSGASREGRVISWLDC